MRRWAIVLLLAAAAIPAMAAKTVSVEQLEQLLDILQGKPDAHVAQQLSDLELAERISPERLAKLEKEFPGSKTREILMRLADAAEFLNTSREDVLPIAAPDQDTQEHMLALAADYVKTTLTRLPNFSATRETTHFEDAPSQEQNVATGGVPSGWRSRPFGIGMGKTEAKPLHSTGATITKVTYQDGYEVHDANGGAEGKNGQPPMALRTNGEFGPILSVVVGDATRNQVTWGHWEQGTGDPLAVLRYQVPDDHSNYMVGIPNGKSEEKVYPGYHGEIAVDPATGQILRLSLVAELMGQYQGMQSAIVVEYAPVEIGDRTYICPVHSVAISRVPVAGSGQDVQSETVQTQMNDVTFTQYHLFGSEAHIVADGKNGPDAQGGAQKPDAAKTDATGAAGERAK